MDWKSSIYQVMASIFGTAWNAKMQRETNENNRMLVDMQNKAAALESEKAYRRSMPSMQIGQMRAAGLSESAAAQAISGGATYQPAPVNVSQEDAPQIDLSQAIQAVTSSMLMRNERKMQEKMLSAQAAEAAANRKNAKEIAQINAEASKYGADASANTAAQRLEFDKSVHDFFKNKQNELLDKQIQSYIESNKASKQQREHFETIKPFLENKAEEEVKWIGQQIQRAKDQSDLDYKKYLLDKIRTTITAKFGVPIDELRNSIDFWSQERGTFYHTIGYAGTNKKLRNLEDVESDFLDYLSKIDEMLEELDKLDK